MKKILHTIYTSLLLASLVAFTLTSCADDELVTSGEVMEGVPITVTLNLGGLPASDVTVSTKASGNDLSNLTNLTIYIYDSQGNFQHKVSNYNGETSLTVEQSSDKTNIIYPVKFSTTSGVKKLLALGNRNGGFWTTDETIDTSQMTFDEFKNYLLSLSYTELNGDISTPIQIVSSEQMLMSGWNEGITFDASGNVTNFGELDGTNKVAVQMKRAMAHVIFRIPSESTTKKIDGGGVHTVTFVPTSYKVYNVPVKSLLANMKNTLTPVSSDDENANREVVTFKNFAASNIGSAVSGNYSFSFYMPENIYDNVSLMTYNMRDAWEGTSLPSSEKKWKYAPPTSTFVVINGTYTEVDENNNTVYTGNVQYTVHLGDFSDAKWGNFSIERNCRYTYNVQVKGVDRIIVEAKKESGEYQNGAEGQIYSYEGTAYTYNLDAHYEQVYLEYNLSSIADAANTAVNASQSTGNSLTVDDAIANNLILVIQSEAMDYTADTKYYTTHNKRGTLRPYKIYIDKLNKIEGSLTKSEVLAGAGVGIEPTKGFDYKWIELWPQTEKTIAPYPGVSDWSKEDLTSILDPEKDEDVYGGTAAGNKERLIDVYDAIVAMGKAVKLIYENKYMNQSYTIETGKINKDKIWITNDNGIYKARFTAFINEYFYYKHPLTGSDVTVWSVFVNKIPREMIIAMSSNVSEDGNSSFSQVYSYISQLSMQTPYSDRNDMILAAFGMETYNETPTTWNSSNVFSDRTVNNTNLTSGKGRDNQLKWLNASSNNTKRLWSTYINNTSNGYTTSNSNTHASHKLPNAYNRKYYDNACMSRNRDLNGNGTIDDNEVRWYLASVNEYLRMGLAAQAISSNARLYQGDKSLMTYSGYPSAYIGNGALYYSSSKSDERVYWAVEKGAWGKVYLTSENGVPKNNQGMPIRCVRVLPAVGENAESKITDLDVEPESFQVPHSIGDYYSGFNTVLEFKNRMVAGMYRTRTDEPLIEHNENDPANRFSEGIIIARNNIKDGYNDASYNAPQINGITYVSSRDGSTTNAIKEDPCTDYHEDGDGGAKWRVPNLNELVMIRRSLDVANLNSLCCTQFSNSKVRLGFVATSNVNCQVAGYNGTYWNSLTKYGIRCVRDVPDGYVFPKN